MARRLPTAARRTAALALAGLLAACGPAPSATPTPASPETPGSTVAPTTGPSASVDAAAVYAQIAGQVEQLRGLQPKAAIAPVLLDAAQLRANLTAEFDKDNPPAVVEATQDLYVALGLLPAGTSLRSAMLDLQSGQVAGYYSPDQKQLFVVSQSGGIGPTQRVTYAHEFTHQLQDQNFDLKRLQGDATDQGDRSLAVLSLIEGDAIATQTAWMTGNLTPDDLARIIADAADPAAVAALTRAPAILRSLSLAPYTDGQAFVAALQAGGGEAAVNAAFASPPASTSQVLHPDLYRSHVAPVTVGLPAGLAVRLGAGWSSLGQDTLGELVIASWLTAAGVDATQASAAAAGWAGDRIEVLHGPGGQVAVAMVLRWTSAADAEEFDQAWMLAAAKATGATASADVSGHAVVIAIAPTAAAAAALRSALRS